MSDVADAVRAKLARLDYAGFDARRVVVPPEDWPAVKRAGKRSAVGDGSGFPRAEIGGVRVVWSETATEPVVELAVDVVRTTPVIGHVVKLGPDGDRGFVTVCTDCADAADGFQADIEDDDVYGEEVPYPECHRCGEVMRPEVVDGEP